MLVKNKMTGEKIERSTAFILKNGKVNLFFDNEEQAEEYFKEKNKKVLCWESYLMLMEKYIAFNRNKKLLVIARKHANVFAGYYDLDYIQRTLKSPKVIEAFSWAINNKDFFSTMAKYNYLYAICKNKLDLGYDSFILDKKHKKDYNDLTSEKEMLKDNTKQTKRSTKKKDISEFID